MLWLMVAAMPLAPAMGIPAGLWLRRHLSAPCDRCEASHAPAAPCPTWH
jgi:hypothetical protein